VRPLYLLVGYQIASNTSALLYVHRPFLVDLVKSINTGLAQELATSPITTHTVQPSPSLPPWQAVLTARGGWRRRARL
jgi:hypothetical protein